MLFSFCFTFNLLIIKKKKKKCAEDSVAVLGHHTNILIIEAGFLIIWRLYNTTMKISEGVIHRGRTFIASIRSMFLFDSACLSANLGDKGLFSSVNILQLVDLFLRVVFLLFMLCFQPNVRLWKGLKSLSILYHYQNNSISSPAFLG